MDTNSYGDVGIKVGQIWVSRNNVDVLIRLLEFDFDTGMVFFDVRPVSELDRIPRNAPVHLRSGCDLVSLCRTYRRVWVRGYEGKCDLIDRERVLT